ncbi:MAG TPA: hypothetical protein DCZ10_00525 [Pelotomaculum sp.]|nr:hypothetical protein [Pelotomaculum sp.]
MDYFSYNDRFPWQAAEGWPGKPNLPGGKFAGKCFTKSALTRMADDYHTLRGMGVTGRNICGFGTAACSLINLFGDKGVVKNTVANRLTIELLYSFSGLSMNM